MLISSYFNHLVNENPEVIFVSKRAIELDSSLKDDPNSEEGLIGTRW